MTVGHEKVILIKRFKLGSACSGVKSRQSKFTTKQTTVVQARALKCPLFLLQSNILIKLLGEFRCVCGSEKNERASTARWLAAPVNYYI